MPDCGVFTQSGTGADAINHAAQLGPLAGRQGTGVHSPMDEKRALLRHFLAALAYRTQKALRDVPASFGTFRVRPQVRTPHELVRHMSGVLNYALTFFGAGQPPLEMLPEFEAEVARFHRIIEELGQHLSRGTPPRCGRLCARSTSTGTARAISRSGRSMIRGDGGSTWPTGLTLQRTGSGRDRNHATEPSPPSRSIFVARFEG